MMPLLHRISALIILILTSAFIATKPILIIPGKSVGTIVINRSTKKAIQREFGKGKIITETIGFCGISHKYKTQLLVLNGITLVLSFKSDKPKANDTVNYIRIYGKNYITEENFQVDVTTRTEITKTYGKASGQASQFESLYPEKGIAFEFKNSKAGFETGLDTLTGIHIFEPRPN